MDISLQGNCEDLKALCKYPLLMTHSTFSHLCLMLKWRPQCVSIKNVMATKSSETAASTSSPLLLFVTATSMAEPQNGVLLYKLGGVASNWKTKKPTKRFLLFLYCSIISTVTRGTILLGVYWIMMSIVVTRVSVRGAGMSSGGWRKQSRGWWWWWEVQYLKLEFPKKTLCHQATLTGTEKLNNLSRGKKQVIGRE